MRGRCDGAHAATAPLANERIGRLALSLRIVTKKNARMGWFWVVFVVLTIIILGLAFHKNQQISPPNASLSSSPSLLVLLLAERRQWQLAFHRAKRWRELAAGPRLGLCVCLQTEEEQEEEEQEEEEEEEILNIQREASWHVHGLGRAARIRPRSLCRARRSRAALLYRRAVFTLCRCSCYTRAALEHRGGARCQSHLRGGRALCDTATPIARRRVSGAFRAQPETTARAYLSTTARLRGQPQTISHGFGKLFARRSARAAPGHRQSLCTARDVCGGRPYSELCGARRKPEPHVPFDKGAGAFGARAQPPRKTALLARR